MLQHYVRLFTYLNNKLFSGEFKNIELWWILRKEKIIGWKSTLRWGKIHSLISIVYIGWLADIDFFELIIWEDQVNEGSINICRHFFNQSSSFGLDIIFKEPLFVLISWNKCRNWPHRKTFWKNTETYLQPQQHLKTAYCDIS